MQVKTPISSPTDCIMYTASTIYQESREAPKIERGVMPLI